LEKFTVDDSFLCPLIIYVFSSLRWFGSLVLDFGADGKDFEISITESLKQKEIFRLKL
jgi:hypothetical protein